MLRSHMSGSEISKELNAATLAHPEWHREHVEELQKMSLNEPPKAKVRINTQGDAKPSEKKENADDDDDLPDFDEIDMKQLQQSFEKLTSRMSRLEITSQAMISILEKLDAKASNSIVLIKLKAISMKKFYTSIHNLINTLESDASIREEVVMYTASGPVVTIDLRNFEKTRMVTDKVKTKVDRDQIFVAGGAGPMKAMVDKVTKKCVGALQETIVKKTEADAKGKGKGKGKHFQIWWPKRISDPAWSIHGREGGEECILASKLEDCGSV